MFFLLLASQGLASAIGVLMSLHTIPGWLLLFKGGNMEEQEKRQHEFLTIEFLELMEKMNKNLNLISQELVKITEAILDTGKI